MTEPEIEVDLGEGVTAPLSEEEVRSAVLYALRAEGVSEGRFSIALVGDADIAALNERYLGHARPTDVLSFHLHEPGDPPIGDVYVGVEQAARQATEAGVPPDVEVARLAIHGTLHVLGYDHPEVGREESAMFQRQDEILAGWESARLGD